MTSDLTNDVIAAARVLKRLHGTIDEDVALNTLREAIDRLDTAKASGASTIRTFDLPPAPTMGGEQIRHYLDTAGGPGTRLFVHVRRDILREAAKRWQRRF
jgi:hypothetical protein